MITKSYDAKKKTCTVLFACHAEAYAHHVSLCGDFNAWHPGSTPMSRNEDGTFSVKVELPIDSKIAFKYIDDHHHWFNDDAADAYEPNEMGEWNSILDTTMPAELKAKAVAAAKPATKPAANPVPAAKKVAAAAKVPAAKKPAPAAKKTAPAKAPAKKAAAKKKA